MLSTVDREVIGNMDLGMVVCVGGSKAYGHKNGMLGWQGRETVWMEQ